MIRPMAREESTRTHDSKGFRKFCQETSLHGWFYFSSDASKWWKMLWLIFLCLIICLSSYVLGANVTTKLEANAVYAVKGETVLTIFTTVLGFLAGLLSPSPLKK